jgi:6-phosphogluconolactonase
MIESRRAPTFVFVGTYTNIAAHPHGKAEGIYVHQLDPASGTLTLAHTVPVAVNPSFLALDPSRRHLYAVNEIQASEMPPGGMVSAFAVDQTTGGLTPLNQQPTHGDDPCHLSVEQTGRFLVAVNYTSGSVAMFPIQDDGRLGPSSDFVQHAGSSVDPQRQQGPHAHSVTVDPTNRFALVADLGLDKVLVYRLDLAQGKLVLNDPPGATLTAGSGPRHVAFHPNGRFVFVINELASTLTAFAYAEANGTLSELQTVPTLPDGFSGRSSCADVHVLPTGKFVYGSNRGHDSIVIYAIDSETGRLSYVGHEPTGGRTPRNFAIDPTGTFLLAANQSTDTIVTFRIDAETGKLTPTGQVANVPTPVCLQIVPMGS